MDVEKRMGLSLDQIIQQKSAKGKQEGGKGPGKKGRGKVKIAKLSGQVRPTINVIAQACRAACNTVCLVHCLQVHRLCLDRRADATCRSQGERSKAQRQPREVVPQSRSA